MAKKKDQGSFWWGYDLGRPQSYTKCIKQIVKICRITLEYAEWQKESKSGAGELCPICGAEYMYVRPETHHYPLTLFEVVENKLQEYIHSNFIDEITPLEFIKEIMTDHLNDKVEYIVLCKSCHEKYHMQDPETMKLISKVFGEQSKSD